MQLAEMRNEVLATGFDAQVYGDRIDNFLNDGQNDVAREVSYRISEAQQTFSTVAATVDYALPTNLARIRTLRDTVRVVELQYVSIEDIDRSPVTQGAPNYYAVDGTNVLLYPTPDATYSLALRYWQMPAELVNDDDVPSLPPDYHNMLISYALFRCYERDDDPQMAQYHQGQYSTMLANFKVDVRFPVSAEPHQINGMWSDQPVLGGPGWSAFGGGF